MIIKSKVRTVMRIFVIIWYKNKESFVLLIHCLTEFIILKIPLEIMYNGNHIFDTFIFEIVFTTIIILSIDADKKRFS